MRCPAMPCHAMPCHVMECDKMQCDAMRCDAVRCAAPQRPPSHRRTRRWRLRLLLSVGRKMRMRQAIGGKSRFNPTPRPHHAHTTPTLPLALSLAFPTLPPRLPASGGALRHVCRRCTVRSPLSKSHPALPLPSLSRRSARTKNTLSSCRERCPKTRSQLTHAPSVRPPPHPHTRKPLHPFQSSTHPPVPSFLRQPLLH